MDARQAIEQALDTLLKGDSTLAGLATGGVFLSPVPAGASRPMVVVSVQAPQADSYTWRRRIMDCTDYMIKGVTDGQSKVAGQQIADRLDQLLTDSNPSLAGGWTVMSIRRLRPVDYPEVPTATDTPIRHQGGIYRFEVTPS